MKNTIVVLMLGLMAWGCSGLKTGKDASSPPEKMELGWIQRADFMTAYPTFSENYDTTHISTDFIDMIKLLHSGVDIVVVLGTWCGDSKREVPRFLKIADLAGISYQQMKFYGVDRSKKSADGVTEKYQIERVPTFIFFKNTREIGRIVESPRNSLEEDMLGILAGVQGEQ